MKYIIQLLLFFTFVNAEDLVSEDELFLTVYIQSIHFHKNDQTNESYNEDHKAYGLEYIHDNDYTLAYNHFVNSRGNDVDVVGAGYMFNFNDEFGLQLIAGYQKGYCFVHDILGSVECRDDLKDHSAYLLPMLYFKYKYVKIDLFTNGDMVSFRYNLKVF